VTGRELPKQSIETWWLKWNGKELGLLELSGLQARKSSEDSLMYDFE
jgi:hypothetical protein